MGAAKTPAAGSRSASSVSRPGTKPGRKPQATAFNAITACLISTSPIAPLLRPGRASPEGGRASVVTCTTRAGTAPRPADSAALRAPQGEREVPAGPRTDVRCHAGATGGQRLEMRELVEDG